MNFIYLVGFILLSCSSMAIIHGPGKKQFQNVVVNDAGLIVQYQSTPTFLLPTVAYEEFVRNGGVVSQCDPEHITLQGTFDINDFQVGHVFSLPTQQNLNSNCRFTAPKNTSQLFQRDEIIFRYITRVDVQPGKIQIATNFVSGAMVVPEVDVSVQGPVKLTDLKPVNDDGINFEINKDGVVQISDGVELKWIVGISGGVNNFKFSRKTLRVTWEQFITAKFSNSLNISSRASDTRSARIYQESIPDIGVDLNLWFIGRLKADFFANVDYDMTYNVAGTMNMGVDASYAVAQRLTLGLQKAEVETLAPADVIKTTPGLNLRTDSAVNANATGFIGLRPGVSAELTVPLLGPLSADFGGTAGLDISLGFSDVPFPPFTDGPVLFGPCDVRHKVRAYLAVEGRKLGCMVKAPFMDDTEFVIADPFFEGVERTACYFQETEV